MSENNKIGEFIQTLRKEKGFTQKELAEIIHVSDKTISKWENGNSVPDTEMLTPLCEALQINVNELISGERIKPEDYSQKAEENLMELLEKDEKNKKTGILFILFGVILIVAGCSLTLLTIGANVTWYIDIPSIILLLLPVMGLVFISGKRKAREVIPFVRKIIVPVGAVISLISSVVVLTKVFTTDISMVGPNLAICILCLTYSIIIYIGLVTAEACMNK